MGTRKEACAAARTPSAAASVDTSTATVPLDNPGADARTTIGGCCGVTGRAGSATETVPRPDSTSISCSSARVAGLLLASSVTLTIARAKPLYAERQVAWCGSLHPGSPFPTPRIRPFPDRTVKVILSDACPTGNPLESTIVARTSATSCPSSTTRCPVPVVGLGASILKTIFVAMDGATRE